MKFFKGFISSVIASLVASFIYAWLTSGPTGVVGSALVPLFSVLGAISVLVISIIYQRYVGVLGAGTKPEGSPERQAYNKLRESVAKDGSAARLYSRRLTRFLDAVDRFFGDAGMPNRILLPRAFGLRTPASLWTAPALDRCLLLALIYPVATIFVIWAITGHVGPAEAALHLKPSLSGWQRGIGAALIVFSTLACWDFFRRPPWLPGCLLKFSWILVAFVCGIIAVAIAGTVTIAVPLVVAIAWTAAVMLADGLVETLADSGKVVSKVTGAVGAGLVAGVISGVVSAVGGSIDIAMALGAVPLVVAAAVVATLDFAASGSVAAIGSVAAMFMFYIIVASFFFIVCSIVAAAVDASGITIVGAAATGSSISAAASAATAAAAAGFVITAVAMKQGWHGVFLALFIPTMILACLIAANLLSPLERWEAAGPLLLFLGLLTVLNAPFDWASLGLTRALLRRGLELGGWWPYLLALVDALLAAVIITVLAIAMVIGVQAYDRLAVHGGGPPILPLDPLFNGIVAHPTAPEYWWIYALLLSTMIPSLVNLAIAGASLLRGLPWLPSLLLRFMPVGKAVPAFDRAWIALVLTLQIVGGTILGIAAQVFLAVVIIGYIMPLFGLGLLDMTRAVAALDLPMKVWQLLGSP